MRGRRNLLVPLAMMLIPKLIVAWTPPVNISNTEMKSMYPAIAIGERNDIHVVWTDLQTDPWTLGEVLYCYYDGDTWSGATNISKDSTSSQGPRIAIDTLGYPHVIWEDWGMMGGPARVYYSFFTGDSFAASLCLTDNLQPGAFTRLGDIAIDSANRIHIVWSAETASVFEVYYVRGEDGSWSLPEDISNNPRGNSSVPKMAMDLGSNLHVAWEEEETDTSSKEVYYARFDGDSWSTPVNISNLPRTSFDQQISVSLEGYPHVVWGEGNNHIYYSFYDGGAWSAPFPLSDTLTQEEGYKPDIAVDVESHPHVVWSGKGGELWYAYYTSTTWTAPIDVSGSLVNALNPDITLDDSNCLHLVWTEPVETSRFEIYYSKHQPTGVDEKREPVLSGPIRIWVFPNLTDAAVQIEYDLCHDSRVDLTIYGLLGQRIKTLMDTHQPAGLHTALWDGTDNCGRRVPSGTYFLRLEAGQQTATRKVCVVR